MTLFFNCSLKDALKCGWLMKKGGGTTTLSRYKKREPFVIQSLRKKKKQTNKRTDTKKKTRTSGDCDTLLHSGVPLNPEIIPGKGGCKARHWGSGDDAPR